MKNLDLIIDIIDILIKTLALLIGGIWALKKITEYREFKNWIQLDVDANIYELDEPETTESLNWDQEGQSRLSQRKIHTHAVEILLKFTNKGKIRIKIFNIQVAANTMRSINETKFDKDDGHLHLTRIHTSGNLVPKLIINGKPVNKTSFYYIEPEVQQTITHLCLISEPRELLQVVAYFSLEKERLFPERMRKPGGLFPHTAARTFQLKSKTNENAKQI